MMTTTTTKDCGCDETRTDPVRSRRRDCVPCDIPQACRNYYYKGKLLTARDFDQEQTYHRDQLRLHQLMLHGWGVACGLKVTPHPVCPDRRIVVEPGFAVDRCGRGTRLAGPIEIPLPKPPSPAKPTGCDDPSTPTRGPQGYDQGGSGATPPTGGQHASAPGPQQKPGGGGYGDSGPKGSNAGAGGYAGQQGGDSGEGGTKESGRGYGQKGGDQGERGYGGQQGGGGYGEGGTKEGGGGYGQQGDSPGEDGCDDGDEPYDLYICVRYIECETEFGKAAFDDCSCTGSDLQPNRVCEDVEIALFEEKPDWWDGALDAECEYADCTQVFTDTLVGCQGTKPLSCIPLAIVHDFVPGQPIGESQIDNWSARPRLVSTTVLDRAIHCILDKLPTKELTKIIDMNWNHGDYYTCHEFMSDYIAPPHGKGFRIQFDSKVFAESINTRTLTATIVRRPRDADAPRTIEIAPARVEVDPDETDWCLLRIDPNYARRHLDGQEFDVYISLRCNVVTGKNGLAVDGDLLAQRLPDGTYRLEFPTGDNSPGGLFESWFAVRRHSRGTGAQ